MVLDSVVITHGQELVVDPIGGALVARSEDGPVPPLGGICNCLELFALLEELGSEEDTTKLVLDGAAWH